MDKGSPTVWISLAPPGPTVGSPERDNQGNLLITLQEQGQTLGAFALTLKLDLIP